MASTTLPFLLTSVGATPTCVMASAVAALPHFTSTVCFMKQSMLSVTL